MKGDTIHTTRGRINGGSVKSVLKRMESKMNKWLAILGENPKMTKARIGELSPPSGISSKRNYVPKLTLEERLYGKKTLKAYEKAPERFTSYEMAAILDVSNSSAQQYIKKWVEFGWAKKVGYVQNASCVLSNVYERIPREQ